MTTHPFLDAGVELDCALRELLRGPALTRRNLRMRDAAAAVHAELLPLIGDADRRITTIDDVQRVLSQARPSGVLWSETRSSPSSITYRETEGACGGVSP